jgi:hypothetical protein
MFSNKIEVSRKMPNHTYTIGIYMNQSDDYRNVQFHSNVHDGMKMKCPLNVPGCRVKNISKSQYGMA